jgi:hypothetical protein
MLYKFSGFLMFRIDPTLSGQIRRQLDLNLDEIRDLERVENSRWDQALEDKLTINLVSESSLHLIQKQSGIINICILESNQGLFSFGQSLEASEVDAILDEAFDIKQLNKIITPYLQSFLQRYEVWLQQQGLKNLKKLESRTRGLPQKIAANNYQLNSQALLDYAQQLVDLEKELFQADGPLRLEKILRQFLKASVPSGKLHLYAGSTLWKSKVGDELLPLPRFKGEFLALEFNWNDEDHFNFIKKVFLYHTLISFLQSRQQIQDPFFDEKLWGSVLDSIPFPVALLSVQGEVYQHNSLFSKLNFAPLDCLNLQLRDKTIIGDIPYNVFRKTVHHLDEEKNLFVFFTESFFLKGDGNLTPSGQELGIISSSIAHELNNPIAGIQAALTLLLLDEDLNEEASTTLHEMKNGATRCKQLVETFLGFSRATPRSLETLDARLSAIEMCYQQAQNLLRFRTVESGIRFSFEYSKHSDFRYQVNLSLLTMTFYLILGELMTLYSHQLLVANRHQIEKVIKGEIIESAREIQIQLHELNISNLGLSKLIQNLLKIENFVLQVSDYSLRFIYSPIKDV